MLFKIVYNVRHAEMVSIQLSEQGKALAGDEPFLIRNGRARELVITKPDHLRDFYKCDTKRKSRHNVRSSGSMVSLHRDQITRSPHRLTWASILMGIFQPFHM